MAQSTFNPSYIGSRSDILNLVPSSCQKILDIGCSVGTLGTQIKERLGNVEVAGIELDKEMAEKAAQKIDKVIVGNIENMVYLNTLTKTTSIALFLGMYSNT